jgi:hypothetical protein
MGDARSFDGFRYPVVAAQGRTTAFVVCEPSPSGPAKPKLLDRVILFHGKRHPSEMGAAEVTAFLTALAVS